MYVYYWLLLDIGWLSGVVLWLFLRETEVKQRWARLVHGWVTVHDRSRFVAMWGVLMQPKNRYRMTPGVRHSGIVNWLIYLFIYLLHHCYWYAMTTKELITATQCLMALSPLQLKQNNPRRTSCLVCVHHHRIVWLILVYQNCGEVCMNMPTWISA